MTADTDSPSLTGVRAGRRRYAAIAIVVALGAIAVALFGRPQHVVGPRSVQLEGAVGEASFSPDGRLIASQRFSATQEPELVIYDANTGAIVRTVHLGTSAGFCRGVRFSPDGRSVVTASGGLAITDVATGKSRSLGTLPRVGTVDTAFAPDGRLISASAAGIGRSGPAFTWFFDTKTMKRVDAWTYPMHLVGPAEFAPDGKSVLIQPFGGTAQLLGYPSKRPIATFPEDRSQAYRGAAFLPGGRDVSVFTREGDLCIWTPTTGAIRELRHDTLPGLTPVAYSADGRFVVANVVKMPTTLNPELPGGQPRFRVTVFDTRTGAALHSVAASLADPVVDLAIAPDGKAVAVFTASGDYGTCRLYRWR